MATSKRESLEDQVHRLEKHLENLFEDGEALCRGAGTG